MLYSYMVDCVKVVNNKMLPVGTLQKGQFQYTCNIGRKTQNDKQNKHYSTENKIN